MQSLQTHLLLEANQAVLLPGAARRSKLTGKPTAAELQMRSAAAKLVAQVTISLQHRMWQGSVSSEAERMTIPGLNSRLAR